MTNKKIKENKINLIAIFILAYELIIPCAKSPVNAAFNNIFNEVWREEQYELVVYIFFDW